MKLKQKIITIFMATILIGENFLPIGQLAIAAANENLENQNSKTNNQNVEFNTYLENNAHESEYNLTEGGKIYVEIGVKSNGYLKNGIVEFSDCNYNFNTNQINSEHIQKIENNSLYLKQINKGENITIELPIVFPKQDIVNTGIFNKESKAKLTGTYINGEGKEITIKKEITNKIKWQANVQAQINAQITKYTPYKLGEQYGVLVQAKVNSSINQNLLPIAVTNLKIPVPVINEVPAENVKVIANKTIATNGEETGLNFTSENYQYSKEENELTINVTNEPNEQGNISWKNGEDEYLITYIYEGKNIYDYVTDLLQKAESTKITEEQMQNGEKNPNEIKMPIQVNGTITTYGIEQKQIPVESSFESTLQEKLGEITDFETETINSISKGYIYANYAKDEKQAKKQQTEEKIKTTYELAYKAKIYNKDLVKEIKLKTNEEKIISQNDEHNVGKNIITNSVKINEKIFTKMLGQEGKIEILNNKQELLATINQETQKDEQGNLILNLEEKNVNEVTIKTSAPITEGTLEIIVEKAFVGTQSFSQEEMKTFNKLILTGSVESNTNSKDYNKEIELVEPENKAEISIEEGNKVLSTAIKNEDVNIKVVLDTSNIQNALYKNPVIKIEMPSEVKKVEIKDANLLLNDELKIKNKKVISENGKQVIVLDIEGTETKYENYESSSQNNVITKGANIIIKTDITLDTLASGKETEVKMYYTNENTNTKEPNVTSTNIEISAPTELVVASNVSGYNSQNSSTLNEKEEKQEIKIPTYTDKRTVTFEGIIANNYNNSIQNLTILGKMPFENNKQIETSEELGSNFTMTLQNAIEVTGIDPNRVKIYYSTQETEEININNRSKYMAGKP